MLSYSKNQKVKGSGYVIDIPDNLRLRKAPWTEISLHTFPIPIAPTNTFIQIL